MKRGLGILLLVVVAIVVIPNLLRGGTDQTQPGDTVPIPPTEPPAATQQPPAIGAYTVIDIDEQSFRPTTRPLSSYSQEELEALPISSRLTVRAVAASDIRQQELEPTLLAIIRETTQQYPDADEVTVFMYSEEGLLGQAYDIGTALWAPGGERGRITPEIARTNDRSTYATSVEVREDVEAYLASRSLDEERHGLSLEQRREYYLRVSQAELRSMDDADREIDPSVDVMANIELQAQLLEQYTAELIAQYGLTQDEHRSILVEGFEKGWPLD